MSRVTALLCAGAAVLAITVLGCRAPASSADASPAAAASAAAVAPDPAVTTEELARDLTFLAHDDLRGRGVGTPGIAAAERYVASRFAQLGLQPLPDNDGFFMPFTVYARGFRVDASGLLVRSTGGRYVASAHRDYRPLVASTTGRVEAPVVFAGYGIVAPEHGHDDYAGLDVAGKVVLVLRYEPRQDDADSPFAGTRLTSHSLFTTKIDNARSRGAAALLVVSGPVLRAANEDLRFWRSYTLEPPDADATDSAGSPFPAAQVSMPLAQRILDAGDLDLRQLQQAADRGERLGAAAELPVTVTLEVAPRHTQQIVARNVAGVLPGSAPEPAAGWIVIGAHHDHLGSYGTRAVAQDAAAADLIFNGADDNASGVAALLELAGALAADSPRSNVLFITFSAEEWGLLGSRQFVATVGHQRARFMLNLDMIGRNPDRPLDVFGLGSAAYLQPLVSALAQEHDLAVETHTSAPANSDHVPFAERDVPYLALFTGEHDDYHRPGDHSDRLAVARMAQITRFALSIVRAIAAANDNELELESAPAIPGPSPGPS